MHRDLRLSNLANLPLNYRVPIPVNTRLLHPDTGSQRIANAACAAGRSPTDIESLAQMMLRVPESSQSLLLPAVYILLDPEGIPRATDLDTMQLQSSFLPSVAILRTLLIIRIPRHLGPDLWPRVWKWISFLHTYREQIPGILIQEVELCFEFLLFAGHLHDKRGAAAFMCSEPGVYFMIARAWKYIFDRPDKDEGELLDICSFLADLEPYYPTASEEILDAVGGPDHLALLLVRHLSWLFGIRKTPVDGCDSYFMQVVVGFMMITDLPKGDPGKYVLSPFATSLRNHGVIPLVAKIAAALAESSGDHVKSSLLLCVGMLARQLSYGCGYEWLPSAANNGLLRAVVLGAPMHLEEKIHLSMKDLLRSMSASLVHYQIPASMDATLPGIRDLVSSAKFRSSTIYEAWMDFEHLVQERLAIAQKFDSEGHAGLKACDNLECSTIADELGFKRCSGCKGFYYCSKECQIVDWGVGGHRDTCGASDVVQPGERHHVSWRDRRFLRAVVHHDYCATKAEMCRQKAIALRRNPPHDLLTTFDYSHGAVRIPVHSYSDWIMPTSSGESWKSFFLRAERSSGRVSRHIVNTLMGNPPRPFLLPLRRSHGNLDRMLVETVSELQELETDEQFLAEFSGKLDSILKLDEENLMETH
ncbi:hypothetical protein C8R43DRAFT_1116055 [Mycena crocata]|nr:hypothetical protein C8R43DRAFT_1116055 [Mycena crocata]